MFSEEHTSTRWLIRTLRYAASLFAAFGLMVFSGCTATAGSNAASTVGDENTNEGSTASDDGRSDTDDPVAGNGEWYRPSVDTIWHWQLQPDDNGNINTGYAVDAYDIDLFDSDAELIRELQEAGRRVICYFSAGTFEDFREDADTFDPADLGEVLEDFNDERWLDIRSAPVREIMLDRLDLAADKGCDAVEPDNVTGFNNDTGFQLTPDDQLDFNRFLADAAHERGLGIGLKNDLSQVDALVDDFDFAVNEQCHEIDECDVLDRFLEAGKPVLNAEYASRYVNNPDEREDLCNAARDRGVHTLILPVDLDDAFRFSCE